MVKAVEVGFRHLALERQKEEKEREKREVGKEKSEQKW